MSWCGAGRARATTLRHGSPGRRCRTDRGVGMLGRQKGEYHCRLKTRPLRGLQRASQPPSGIRMRFRSHFLSLQGCVATRSPTLLQLRDCRHNGWLAPGRRTCSSRSNGGSVAQPTKDGGGRSRIRGLAPDSCADELPDSVCSYLRSEGSEFCTKDRGQPDRPGRQGIEARRVGAGSLRLGAWDAEALGRPIAGGVLFPGPIRDPAAACVAVVSRSRSEKEGGCECSPVTVPLNPVVACHVDARCTEARSPF